MSTSILIALGLILSVAGASAMLAPRMAQLAIAGPQKAAQNTGGEATKHEARTSEETDQAGQPDKNAAKSSKKASEGKPGEAASEAGGGRNSGGSFARAASAGKGTEEAASDTAERTVEKESIEKGKDRLQRDEGQGQEQTNVAGNKDKPEPPAPSDPTMSMTIPRLAAVQGDTVLNSASPQALDQAAMKLPSTGFPWQEGANTYIAGHRIGWPGTETLYQFYYLPAMRMGDAVYLTDANGTTYEYRVTEKFAVSPAENWVTQPVAGRDMVTLQTCTETVNDWWTIGPRLMESGPDSGRLIVRADKVATYPPVRS